MIDLKGKVALVTGASRGIGAAVAIKFAEAGADVVINYFSREAEAEQVAAECRWSGRRAITFRADVSREADVGALFDAAAREFSHVDIVVANAGIWKEKAIDDLDVAAWDETIDANLKSVYLTSKAAAAHFKERGGGSLITVSSTAGQRGEAFHSHYAASKGGIIAFTKSLASELGQHGITVNCVAPGWVETEMSARTLDNEAEVRKILAATPVGRIATADDIAGPILFLASDLARHLTGEVLNVNGGSVLCG